MKNKNDYEYEIDMSSLFGLIAKRKKIVLSVTLLFTIAAATLIFGQPESSRLYIFSTIFKLPKTGSGENIIEPERIQGDIQEGVYDTKIANELGMPPESRFNFNVTLTKSRDYIKVHLKTPEAEFKKVQDILGTLLLVLKAAYQPLVDDELSEVETGIVSIKSDIFQTRLNKEIFKKGMKETEPDVEVEYYLLKIKEFENKIRLISSFEQVQPPIAALLHTTSYKIKRVAAFAMLGLFFAALLSLLLELWQQPGQTAIGKIK